MYSYSTDEELYCGEFATAELAVAEAADSQPDGHRFWVGENVRPTQPETMWHAEDWLELVSVQDEYSCEWTEGWDESTYAQRAELETAVRTLMAEWLDRHGLRPRFWNITKPQAYMVVDGKPQKV
jgi:hypothetical protein